MRNEDNSNEQIENNPDLQKSLKSSGVEVKQKKGDDLPIYNIVQYEQKIPVSKAMGKIWKARIDRGLSKRKNRYESRWEESIRYYNETQDTHRTGNDDEANNEDVAARSKRRNSQTENLVFANTSALVPRIYAKNPDVEFTERENIPEDVLDTAEAFCNKMLHRRAYPKFALKPHLRRAIVCTTLTNVSYIEVGFTKRVDASEAAVGELQELTRMYEEAKDMQEVRRIEGRIMALEERISFLRPEGPWCRFLDPTRVVRPAECSDEQLINDPWIAVIDYLPTAYLAATYGKNKNGEDVSVFSPTHVLKAGEEQGHDTGSGQNSVEAEVITYEILDKGSSASDYGYNNDDAYKNAQMTKCFWVWDKTTRRLLLFADNNWSMPVWVWDDPYQLDDFYPIRELTYYTDPIDGFGNSEVSYYLDQQDSINEKLSEERQARRDAKFNLMYNKRKVNGTEIDAMLASDRPRSLGVDVPDGMTLKDMIAALIPPATQHQELFDKSGDYQAIQRISSVNNAMLGGEFRTNTTNDAVSTYNSASETRLDEKIDAIEDTIAEVTWIMFQMCTQFMSEAVVAMVIGKKMAAHWQQLKSTEFRAIFGSMQVVGGSTQKPNTEAKQKRAIESGQVLGQFVQAAPITAAVTLRMFQRAFDDVEISRDEWKAIMDGVQQVTGPTPDPNARGDGTAVPNQGQFGQQGDPMQLLAILDQSPPQVKQAVFGAVMQGVPIAEAVSGVLQRLQGGAPQPGATSAAPPQNQPAPSTIQ